MIVTSSLFLQRGSVRCGLLNGALLLSAASLSFFGLSELNAADRAEVTPAAEKAPQSSGLFHAILAPEEYERRVSKLDPDLLDPAKIEANKLPDWGLYIRTVQPGGMAEDAGVKPGWVMTSCKGREMWNGYQSLDAGDPGKREFVFVTPEGEEKVFSFGPGMIGIQMENHSRPERAVLRGIPRGPWDRDVLVAVQGRRSGQLDLAETAMSRAESKGMPSNPYADFYGAFFALHDGDRELAETLCEAVQISASKAGEIPRFFRQGMRTLALSLNDMKLLAASGEELRGIREQLQPEEIRYWTEHGAAGMKKSLLKTAADRIGEDVMGKTVKLKDGFEKRAAANDPRALAKKNQGGALSAGDMITFAFQGEEPMQDLIWEIKGVCTENAVPGIHYVSFALIDPKIHAAYAEKQAWQPQKWQVVKASLVKGINEDRITYLFSGLDGGAIATSHFWPKLDETEAAQLHDFLTNKGDLKDPNPDHVFDLKLIRIGNEVEVNLNGVTCLHLPIHGDVGNLGCEIEDYGYDMLIQESTLRPIKASD